MKRDEDWHDLAEEGRKAAERKFIIVVLVVVFLTGVGFGMGHFDSTDDVPFCGRLCN